MLDLDGGNCSSSKVRISKKITEHTLAKKILAQEHKALPKSYIKSF